MFVRSNSTVIHYRIALIDQIIFTITVTIIEYVENFSFQEVSQ